MGPRTAVDARARGEGADRADRARAELNGNPMQEVNFIHHFVDLVEPFLCYVLISAQYLCPLIVGGRDRDVSLTVMLVLSSQS